MNKKIIKLLTGCGIAFCSISNAEIKELELTKNPFIKPHYENDNSKNNQDIIVEVTLPISQDSLRATLSAENGSIANIDGIMFSEGDKFKGYELIDIGEGYVTLIKNDEEVTLYVSNAYKDIK